MKRTRTAFGDIGNCESDHPQQQKENSDNPIIPSLSFNKQQQQQQQELQPRHTMKSSHGFSGLFHASGMSGLGGSKPDVKDVKKVTKTIGAAAGSQIAAAARQQSKDTKATGRSFRAGQTSTTTAAEVEGTSRWGVSSRYGVSMVKKEYDPLRSYRLHPASSRQPIPAAFIKPEPVPFTRANNPN